MANLSPEEELQAEFSGRPWFHSVGRDQYNRLVVYTNFMCHETLHDIPDKVAGIQVLVHFASSKTATREQFTNVSPSAIQSFVSAAEKAQANGIDTGVGQAAEDVTEFAELMDEGSLRHLTDELDRLEKQCGSNILQDIFYEIHDKHNAVTNLSAKFPEVRRGLEKLFNQYGFDVIYEELDG